MNGMRVSLIIAGLLMGVSAPLFAGQQPHEFEGVSGALSVLLSLGVVLAVVFALAWGMRRMHGFAGGRDPNMTIIGQMALSTRERLMLVEVGGQQLLLGVSPAGIRTLHVLEEPVEGRSSGGGGASFRDRLMESLGKGTRQ